MEIVKQDYSKFERQLKIFFEEKYQDFSLKFPERAVAFQQFITEGFPTRQLESWRNTDLAHILNDNYHIVAPNDRNLLSTAAFHCNVQGINVHEISITNGFSNQKLIKLDNDVIYGSLQEAILQYPDLVSKHFGKYNKHLDGFSSLNDTFWLDGAFVYVPDNISLDLPLQILNAYNWDEQLFLSVRNLIVLGKNSKMTLLHCDDSLNHHRALSNSVSEIYMDEYSEMDYYKLQNINNKTAIVNRIIFYQEQASRLNANQVSLNGGLLRNDIHVKLDGKMSDADVSGAYLMDKNQMIDNHVHVHHAVSDCTSNQEFRGVLDDYAATVFNGYILVDKDAQKTAAQQSCRHILVSDKAKIETQPFLEIYADDVKCSHGASVGQLDNEALFYMRSRGIDEQNARTLLTYAFVSVVLDKIKIKPLRERYADMIKQRLSGNLGICGQCVLDCSIKEKMEQLDGLKLF
ncbi:MAG: Fe-S cluster assembly protein SufD [Bacteroidales bacterium]|jgi:Fe-S cluster assembly protein SufD|nr:Fe-S cluster assembly protein SufD [Bacteroidales bacterium]